MESTPEQFILREQLLTEYLTSKMQSYFFKMLPKELPHYIELKIVELLKYLVLAHYIDGPIPFSKEMDELWHLWILQTQQYQELCLSLPGKKFIHHSSNDYGNQDPDIASSEAFSKQLSFLVSYRHNFGEFTSDIVQFWPYAKQIMMVEKLDINGFNQYLMTTDGIDCV